MCSLIGILQWIMFLLRKLTFWNILPQFSKFNNIGMLNFSELVCPRPLLENLTNCISLFLHTIIEILASYSKSLFANFIFPFYIYRGSFLVSNFQPSSHFFIDDNVNTFRVIFKNSKRVLMYYLFIQRQSSRKHISAKLQKFSVL